MDSAGGGGGGGAPWRRQGSTSGGGGTNPSALAPPTSVPPAPAVPGVAASPPPPPPMTPAGAIPPTRLSTEIGPRESKGPPLALAGAMMKDKKPFTYTPGKIDLSEIRNPRMARRLLMNAQAEGVTSVPSPPAGHPSNPPMYLPPAALAAMNPAMAIPVLPQGAFNFRNKSVPKEKPEFMRSPSENQERQMSMSMMQQVRNPQQQQQRVQRGQSPSTSASTNAYNNSSSPSSSDVNSRQSASYAHPGTTYMQSQQQLSSGNIGTDTSRRSPSPLTPELHPRATAGLGLRPTQTKVTPPAPGQNLGSIYIPPNEHQMRQSIFSDRPPTSSVSPNSLEHHHATCSPMSESLTTNNSLPATTQQLSKAPTPWMNSYNRIQPPQPQQQPPSQSPLPANNNVGAQNVNVTPWGTSLSGTISREPGEPDRFQYLAHNSSASGAAPSIRSPSSGFNPITNPLLTAAANSSDTFSKQEANVGVQRLPREDSFYNYVPSQSKSFKVIQQITDDVDEGTSFAPIESRTLGAKSPTPRAFRQSYPPNLPSSPGPGAQDYISSYPFQTGSGLGSTNFQRMASQPQAMRRSPLPETFGTPGQDSADAEQDFISGSIRNLKLLRTPLNDEPSDTNGSAAGADQSNRMRLKKKLASRPPRPPCRSLSSTPTPTSSSVNGSSSNPKANFVRSRTVSPSPTPRPANCTCSCNCTNNYSNVNNNNYYNNNQSYPGSESETEDYNPPAGPNPRSYSPWPENFDPYDPYAYMQWYYWWYYNYGYPMGWNGYDYSNSRSATPNPNSATESSNNYKSDSEQSDKNYYSHSEDNEETLQSVARNISSYKFGAEENGARDERQGSVPRIIVNRSPDPSSPANISQLQNNDALLQGNPEKTQQRQHESKYMENFRKHDLANKEFKSYENPRNGHPEAAEMDARQRMLQEIRTRENAKSSSFIGQSMNENSTIKSEFNSTEKSFSDSKQKDITGNSTKPKYSTPFDATPGEGNKNEKRTNDFSKFDVTSNQNLFSELKTNGSSRVDVKAIEKSAFSLTNNDKSIADMKLDLKSRSGQASNENTKGDLASSVKPRFDVKANENGRYEVKMNENGRFDLKSNENSRFDLKSNENSRFDLKSNENSRFDLKSNENSRFDLKSNENSRFETKPNENSIFETRTNEIGRNDPKADQRTGNRSSLFDSFKLTASVCDTEATQKSVKLESNEESESERTKKSDVLYCSSDPEPGQRVIRNSHTRETVLPSTPSSSSFSSSSSELFSEREDNYFDCREDRGYEESDADIFRPYSSAGLVREDIVEVDENTKSGRSNVGFIEEPETDISEEDAPTLVEEAAFSPGVVIEECYSSEETPPESRDQFAYPTRPPTRLSTIDETTERSRTTFPILDEEEDTFNYKDDDFQDTVEDLSEDEESNDENSSVSVIENKSDGHIDWGATTGGESHADEASTSSSDAEDENDDDPLLPTVTVNLPAKLSFNKSRSFRDVPTVLGGNSKEDTEPNIVMEVPQPKEKFTYQSGNHDIEELSQSEEYSCDDAKAGLIDEAQTESEFSVIENCIIESEIDDEPVVSFTISLSRTSTSKSCGKKYEDDSECGDDLEVDHEPEESPEVPNHETESIPDEPDIDFWGEIQKSEDSSETSYHDNDFWRALKPKPIEVTSSNDDVEDVQNDSAAHTATNAEESNFWDRGRTFGTKAFSRQFSWNLPDEDELEESKATSDLTAEVEEEPKVVEASPPTETRKEKDTSDQYLASETKSEKIASETKSERNSSETKLGRSTSETKSERSTSETKSERCTSETRSERSTAENKSERNSVESRSLKSEEKGTKITEEIKTSSEKTKIKTKESSTETKITENQTKYKNSTETTEEVRMRNKEKTSTCKMDTIFSNRKLDDCDFSTSVRNNHTTNDHIKSYRHSIGKIPFKEENSDESTDCETKQDDKFELKRTTSLTKKEINERNIEIKETRENFRVRPSSLNFELNQAVSQPDTKKEDSKLESTDLQKMARAEDLLWRIERFLQESLSLGSEDDSGVMTDISRQISDVDTDNDVETEVVTRNKTDAAINRAARALKTQSLIETAAEIKAYEKVDTTNVVLRNFSTEKKSLRYQRAKTHSRLFQLLQDECHKDGDDEVDVILEETIDFENLEQVEAAIEKKSEQESKRYNRKAISDQKDRFLPDKMKGNLTSSTSVDSTSSSSGVLSPSSPVSRDQLLVDIINGISSAKKKGANFPSKIFKLLQQKFGEEFYDTFECCEDDFDCPATPSNDNETPQPSFFENRLRQRVTATPTREISHKTLEESENKRCSWKKDQLLEDSSSKSKTEFLQVPARRKKSILNRDPRVPKTKATPKV